MKSTDTLTDTGFLVALLNDSDTHHAAARRMLGELAGEGLRSLPDTARQEAQAIVGQGLTGFRTTSEYGVNPLNVWRSIRATS